MSGLVALYGTEEPVEERRPYRLGPVSFELCGGAVRYLAVGGSEVVRRIAFLARDRDWGTLAPTLGPVEEKADGASLRLAIPMRFQNGAARLDTRLTLTLRPDGLDFEAEAVARGVFETNRAGFTILHPIAGQAGSPVTVVHGAGGTEEGTFPETIAPWQPFKDIAAITHHVGVLSCTCRLEGDVFEMEDQRQWGDASFKTYNRPLALPWPYRIDDGATIRQAVRVSWRERKPAQASVRPTRTVAACRFPETAILLTPEQARRALGRLDDIRAIGPQRLLCHVDASRGDLAGQFAAFADLQRAAPAYLYDIEMIADFGDDPAADPAGPLDAAAGAMRETGLRPASVMVCPSVDRQSTPPGSTWPACPPLDLIHAAARAAFAAPLMGGGMASFFPELNRKRPPVGRLDFVSHSLCPIVHDAGDRAVIETLEAVPHITRSARAIIGDRPYRIGPSTIAMRQNPYGARTIPNPEGRRVAMADDDPRHRARFGAAYALGLAAALAPAKIAVWTPAELYGPRGIVRDDGGWHPLTHVVAALAACASSPVAEATIDDGLARLVLGKRRFTANLTDAPLRGLEPYGWSGEGT
ncbi:hypothetical protein [Jiella sonneratiae]|uniref:Uncharacterized protein n=1 Tax=Jiella sonneratiae TaxID=2816856 RepID=A0ABS3J1F9_9HYPH|nr:hypothetical protein [Jiella sonneratiae]MBO0903524.1 hypothetical protein [Jiella sonneratiae]